MAQPADPDYRRALGNGLVARWATPADHAALAELMGRVWQAPGDDGPNPRIVDQMRRKLRGEFPPLRPYDVAVVEAHGAVVASGSLWRIRWSYAGIPFAVGQPEWIGTDPAFRNRGCVRALMELLHARSAAYGDLVQAIDGIPFFYRLFGYEYALELNARRSVPVDAIMAQPDTTATYRLRDAVPADAPHIAELYARRRGDSLVWNEVDPEVWQAKVAAYHAFLAEGRSAAEHGIGQQLLMLEDQADRVCGFALVATKGWASDLQVYAVELAPGVDVAAVVPWLLRALVQHGHDIPPIRPTTPPLRALSLLLGSRHPIYAALPAQATPESPYAWYLRVPDLAALLRHIAPALEQRLAASACAGYDGTLAVDCYGAGLRLVFAQGRIVDVIAGSLPAGTDAGLSCPGPLLLKLVFGYRSLAELQHMFPEVLISPAARPLVEALFPPAYSWVFPL